MQCPVCKAENSQGPACRRCKADLTLLWELEERRQALLSEAQHHLTVGATEPNADNSRGARPAEWRLALEPATEAMQLRAGTDAGHLIAIARLLARDFAGAWHAYLAVKATSERETTQTAP
jgi:hypothetical protein